MNGVHPTTLGEQVVRKICFYYSGNYCKRSKNIDVTNCGDYYVYKLQAAPICDLGYCADGWIGNLFCLNVGFKIHHSEALPNPNAYIFFIVKTLSKEPEISLIMTHE